MVQDFRYLKTVLPTLQLDNPGVSHCSSGSFFLCGREERFGKLMQSFTVQANFKVPGNVLDSPNLPIFFIFHPEVVPCDCFLSKSVCVGQNGFMKPLVGILMGSDSDLPVMK